MTVLTDSQKRSFLKLKAGQKLKGTVKRITNYGAFIKLGVVDGLLATKDITWGRIKDPEDFLKLRQKVEVMVLSVDDKNYRVALGIKQLLPNPWELAKTKYKEGDTVIGHVVSIVDYGAFLEILPGFEGLVHVSEIYTDKKISSGKDFFLPGQAYEATIIKLDFENRKLGLSIK